MNKDIFDYAMLQNKLIIANEKIIELQEKNEDLESLVNHYRTSREHWNTIARENFKLERTMKALKKEIIILCEKYFRECVPGGCNDMSDLIKIIDEVIGDNDE